MLKLGDITINYASAFYHAIYECKWIIKKNNSITSVAGYGKTLEEAFHNLYNNHYKLQSYNLRNY
jgi:hypothetical protein